MVYVTCYYDIYNNPQKQSEYFNWFRTLVVSGLPICVFTSEQFRDRFLSEFPNVPTLWVIIEPLENFEMYKIGTRDGIRLPLYRNLEKDTAEYMAVQNMKSEILYKCKQIITDSVYIWIDFGIVKILPSSENNTILNDFMNRLTAIHNKLLSGVPNKIWIPGCWEKTNFSNSNYNNVQWRFCGGFVICPSHLVETLCQHNYELFKDACENKNTIWEVNIWSMIEDLLGENSYFHWYKGDHNETILPSWDLIHTL